MTCHLPVSVNVNGLKRGQVVSIQANHGARRWMKMMPKLRNHEVKGLLNVSCAGPRGLWGTIALVWPSAIMRTCLVRLICNHGDTPTVRTPS